jgi:uncharacterized protein YdbL (DUF1318 family)
MTRALLIAFVFLLAAAFAAPARAADLDSYRAQGVIAERFDGLLELKDPNAPADAKALVDSVNAKRTDIYKKRAAADNVPADTVGKIYAKQIFDDAPAGTFFRQPDGSYARK